MAVATESGVVTVTSAEVAPSGMITDAGTLATVARFEASDTVTPPDPAARFNVTVAFAPVAEPPTTDAGVNVTEATLMSTTLVVADLLTPL